MGDVVDPSTGVRFPLFQTFWDGIRCRSLGVGPREKKVAFVKIKASLEVFFFMVYSVTYYVDEVAAKADLQQAQQAGKLGSDEGVCQALTGGAYTKAFQMQLVRNVSGAQFTEAFEESLAPRMQGDTAPLEAFKAYFKDKHLDNKTHVVLLWRQPGDLDVLAKAGTTISSAHLCKSLWENYLDPSSPTPVARQKWIAGARALLST
ncbi:hypothetical protein N2152v2_006886 [Parachlorella kessleri]